MNAIVKLECNPTPGVIDTNYDAVVSWLGKELERFDVVVTSDTVVEARKMCAELNKMKGGLSAIKKDAVSKVSEPIKAFEQQMKSLSDMCETGRQNLIAQINKFDQERLAIARAAVEKEVKLQYIDAEIWDKYQTINCEDFVKLGAITAKGSLTAATCNAILSCIKEIAAKQDKYQARVARLASVSELAGLSTTLVAEDASHFLDMESDIEYDSHLNKLVARAQEREKKAERRMAEATQAAKADPVVKDPEPTVMAAAPISNPVPEPPPLEPSPEPGRSNVSVACIFKTSVVPGVTDEKIEAELRRVLEKAGIKTLHSIHITRSA